ncbi:hypothetical protein N657DRAFT_668843 [Parathielavia appendiculata]|uniref:RRM domain-containing protein n=1 Tax=Parathielavia appendiculata TaxID=2587402 RepID=A0AAN6Z6W7_9PEZI|nr:hypothetical protein N657DRAFT_668843 [Parathielavia appendiculata]
MAATVHVKNIGGETEDKEVKDFFSFCGKIASIEIKPEGTTKSATVTFEKETAARTALLLNHTKLGGNEITVTGESADAPPRDTSSSSSETTTTRDTAELSQEEKPRSRILAEILAHGYLVADQGLQTAIKLDEQHNISSRFVSTLRQLDERTHAIDRARAADSSYGISQRATNLWNGLWSYFESSKDTPTGRKIVNFYTSGGKQVQDIHNEARRLAELKKQEGGGSLLQSLGLDKVMGRFQSAKEGESSKGGAAGSEKKDIPGAAPADAARTESAEKPTAQSGVGNPETIH